jgi:hypothetical protein
MNRFFIKQLVEVLKKIKEGTASTQEIDELWTYCEKNFNYKIEAQDADFSLKNSVK